MKNMKNIKTIHNINLKSYNTLRLDTTAQIAYFPKNTDELILLIKKIEKPIIIGGGSNIIFSSKGIKNPIILLKDLNGIKIGRYIKRTSVQDKFYLINEFLKPHNTLEIVVWEKDRNIKSPWGFKSDMKNVKILIGTFKKYTIFK